MDSSVVVVQLEVSAPVEIAVQDTYLLVMVLSVHVEVLVWSGVV